MANGYKTGGRKKRNSEQEIKRISRGAKQSQPTRALLKIAKDKDTPLDMQIKINTDLLAYMYPKRKAIEMKHEQEFNKCIDVHIIH